MGLYSYICGETVGRRTSSVASGSYIEPGCSLWIGSLPTCIKELISWHVLTREVYEYRVLDLSNSLWYHCLQKLVLRPQMVCQKVLLVGGGSIRSDVLNYGCRGTSTDTLFQVAYRFSSG